MAAGVPLTEKDLKRAVVCRRKGWTLQLCASRVGVEPSSLANRITDGRRDLQAGKDTVNARFAKAWDDARDQALDAAFETIQKSTDWRAQAKLIEWEANGIGRQHVEVTGSIEIADADAEWADRELEQLRRHLEGDDGHIVH